MQLPDSEAGVNASPFEPANESAYRAWRARKLAGVPARLEELVVEIEDPTALRDSERAAIVSACRRANLALYRCRRPEQVDKAAIRRFGAQLGLHSLDGNLYADADRISALQVMPPGRQQEYIPYSDRPLNWHTDGYYNAPDRPIRAFLIHCVRAALRGGHNRLLDPELVYLTLRDANPEWIATLMEPDVMTIPANVEDGVELRPACTGPVFSIDPATGCLHMRYTARRRYIQWRKDRRTRVAVDALEDLLHSAGSYMFQHRLEPGEGVVCNNVLHDRAAFEDHPTPGRGRLLYRARYHDRIAGTACPDAPPAHDEYDHVVAQ